MSEDKARRLAREVLGAMTFPYDDADEEAVMAKLAPILAERDEAVAGRREADKCIARNGFGRADQRIAELEAKLAAHRENEGDECPLCGLEAENAKLARQVEKLADWCGIDMVDLDERTGEDEK